jgi:PQ loop repeat
MSVLQFRRRSVEGLSMLLFLSAFMGNVFYCLSIIFNPQMQTSDGASPLRAGVFLANGGSTDFSECFLPPPLPLP